MITDTNQLINCNGHDFLNPESFGKAMSRRHAEGTLLRFRRAGPCPPSGAPRRGYNKCNEVHDDMMLGYTGLRGFFFNRYMMLVNGRRAWHFGVVRFGGVEGMM